jgi:hypothetical protein
MSDLSTSITESLKLVDPFMIASSHWTSGEKAFSKLEQLKPSAITLKTTSTRQGGDGESSIAKPREWAEI